MLIAHTFQVFLQRKKVRAAHSDHFFSCSITSVSAQTGSINAMLEAMENDDCFFLDHVSPLTSPAKSHISINSGDTEVDLSPKRPYEDDDDHVSKRTRSSSSSIEIRTVRQYNQAWQRGRSTFVISRDRLYFVKIVTYDRQRLTAHVLEPIQSTGAFWATRFRCSTAITPFDLTKDAIIAADCWDCYSTKDIYTIPEISYRWWRGRPTIEDRRKGRAAKKWVFHGFIKRSSIVVSRATKELLANPTCSTMEAN